MKMNYLEKLLQGQRVEWKTLGEVANYEQPTKYLVKSTNYSDTFATPVLTAGKTFILGYTDETSGIYPASINPVIIFDDFTTANKWVDFDFKAKSSAMKMITSKDENQYNLKYIYYWLNTLPETTSDNDHKRQWISIFCNKEIPIPPLPVQKEIVKILDALTALTSELTSELTLRQKQYQYYRDKLLTFGDEVEWKTLGEVAVIGTGSHDTQDAIDDGDYIFYARGISPLRLNTYDFDEIAIITAGDGVGVGKVFHWAVGRYALHQRAYRIAPNSDVSARYIYYYMVTNFYSYIQKNSVSSSFYDSMILE